MAGFWGPGRSRGWGRRLVAVLFAPLIGTILGAVLVTLTASWLLPWVARDIDTVSLRGFLPLFTGMTFVTLIVAYPAMIVLGLPVQLLLKAFRLESGLTYAMTGAMVGEFLLWLLMVFRRGVAPHHINENGFGRAASMFPGVDFLSSLIIPCGLIGAIIGIVTWAIVRDKKSAIS